MSHGRITTTGLHRSRLQRVVDHNIMVIIKTLLLHQHLPLSQPLTKHF